MVRHRWHRAGACIIGLVTAACFVDGGVHRKTAVWKSSPQTRKNSVKFVRQQAYKFTIFLVCACGTSFQLRRTALQADAAPEPRDGVDWDGLGFGVDPVEGGVGRLKP
mmetsp:Transcript_61439/g.127204  ORF Transcript_61439/g.127204 Transcript_61439/m.127204 type:complete len:108 (-) Transcript_61439:23-346(-)